MGFSFLCIILFFIQLYIPEFRSWHLAPKNFFLALFVPSQIKVDGPPSSLSEDASRFALSIVFLFPCPCSFVLLLLKSVPFDPVRRFSSHFSNLISPFRYLILHRLRSFVFGSQVNLPDPGQGRSLGFFSYSYRFRKMFSHELR